MTNNITVTSLNRANNVTILSANVINKIEVTNSKAKYYAELAQGYMQEAQSYAQIASAVMDNEENINTVSGNIEDVNMVADNIVPITNTANSIIDIINVSENIEDVRAVNTISNDVQTVADITSEIITTASIATDITTVKNNVTNINTVVSNISNINAVANDLTNIDNAGNYAAYSQTNANLAQDWANKMNGTVDGIEYSAKYYAQQASQGQVQADWTESDTTKKLYIKNKPSLATVATSGRYNDLTNKPTIPTVPTTLSAFMDDLGSNPTHTHSQYLTSHQNISGKENTSNKVTSLSSSSTDTQYPSAKCVYDLIGNVETLLQTL